jgi:threonine/homoserine/homoserine lactone efflux protein
MASVIGDILALAVGVAISPIPIIAVVLLLSTPKGKGNSLSFLLGWLIGLGLVGVIVLLVADPAGASEEGAPAAWVGWLILILGVLAIVLGIRQFLGRPRAGEEPPMPKWMGAIDKFKPGQSFGIGFVLAAVNPKNLTLTLAAAATIAGAGLTGADPYIVLAVFVIIGTLGLAIPIGIYFLGGDKASETLAELRHWLAVNNASIMAVLFVVIGAKLVGNGLDTVLA